MKGFYITLIGQQDEQWEEKKRCYIKEKLSKQ